MNKLQRTVNNPARPTRTLAVAPFEGFDRSNCLAVQQEIIDDQLADFTEGELKVMLIITRATNGGQREAVPMSVRVLCDGAAPEILPGRGTGLSPRTVQAACAALETIGCLRVARRMAPDGSGLPSLFTLPLVVPGMRDAGEPPSAKFPGYAAGRRVRLPLLLFDKLLSELSGAELKVLLYILRHTFCMGVPDEIMPMARLVENTGLSLRHTRLAVAGLTTRGVIMVQHRQDPERGKLASRFGVKVIGEAAPFAALPVAPGIPTRTVRPEEPVAEQPRPVWLVPAIEQVTPPPQTPATAAARPAETAAVPEIKKPVEQPVPHVPAEAAIAAQHERPGREERPAASAPPPVPTIHSSLPPGSLTPIRVAGQTPRNNPPAPPRQVPPAMIKDNNPAWAAVKQLLSERLPFPVFVERIAPTSSVGDNGPELLIAVQDEYHRWWLESKLARQVKQALADAGYGGLALRYLNFFGERASEPDLKQ